MKQKQPDNTFMLCVIIALVFGVIIMFFGTYTPNSNDDNLMNCLLDGNSIESCLK